MAIDTSLTYKGALEAIGPLKQIGERRGDPARLKKTYKEFGEEDGYDIHFGRDEAGNTVWHITWEFSGAAKLVTGLQHVRYEQKREGMDYPNSRAHVPLKRTGIAGLADRLKFQLGEEEGIIDSFSVQYGTGRLYTHLEEALLNAIEHGTNFGRRGRVSPLATARVEMYAGENGATGIVEHPGKHYPIEPMGEEELRLLEERVQRENWQTDNARRGKA